MDLSICVHMCTLYAVCLHDTSKHKLSSLKLEHIVVFENNLNKFDIGYAPNISVILGCFLIYIQSAESTSELWDIAG